jgi:hypothetical protein
MSTRLLDHSSKEGEFLRSIISKDLRDIGDIIFNFILDTETGKEVAKVQEI